jgi:hypothetical protein
VLTDAYQLPTYWPGYFAFGSDGSGELLICALHGDDKRPLHRLAAIGMSDVELLPLAASFEDLSAQIERAGLTWQYDELRHRSLPTIERHSPKLSKYELRLVQSAGNLNG